MVASTGVIEQPYPTEKVNAALDRGRVGAAGFEAAVAAIMTRDTHAIIASATIGDAAFEGSPLLSWRMALPVTLIVTNSNPAFIWSP